MRRPKKIALWIASPLVLVLLALLGLRFFVYDWDDKPFCHKQMTSALRNWANEDKPIFPNVEGDSLRSMQALADALYSATNFVFPDYKYVPGLREGDPPDLVLFYFNRPTRWRSHVQTPPTVWSSKTWIVVPVDAFMAGDGRAARTMGRGPDQIVAFGEQSQSLTTEQFTNRLLATLQFLRTNNRPHWEAVVREHTEFLNSLAERR